MKVKNKKNQKSKFTIFLVFVSVFFSLFIYRPIFNGRMLGEPFDARLMIALHEHMWRWLNGLTSFRDTEFFYPYDTALGFSDVFLVQGAIYSFFRFIKLDIANSWLITTIFLVILGNLGWVKIARDYIKSNFLQILFVLSMVSSVSFVNYFVFNANIVGYAFVSWFAVLYRSIKIEKNTERKQLKIVFSIFCILLYSLSCWYGAFFVIFTLSIKFIIDIISNPKKISFNFTLKNLKILVPLLILNGYLIWLFLYVYVSISNQPTRSTDELIRNSPYYLNLIGSASPFTGKVENAFFQQIYNLLGLDKAVVTGENLGDFGGGVGIFSIFFSLLLFLVNQINSRIFSEEAKWFVAVSFAYLYFTVILNETSIHTFLFENIIGFNSIRSPSRYTIFVGYFLIFIIFFNLSKLYNNFQHNYKKIIFYLIPIILFFDQIRAPFSGWDKNLLYSSELNSLTEQIVSNCDFFYYDRPGGWWFDQIEALTYAIQIGVPTANGYSGAYPPKYPGQEWKSERPSVEMFTWIAQVDESKRGCFISNVSKLRKLNESFVSVDFFGFTEQENYLQNSWNWAVAPNTYLLILNTKSSKTEIEFNLNPSPCFKNQKIQIRNAETGLVENIILNKEINFNFVFSNEMNIANVLEISTDSIACQVEGDPRDLYFNIKNIKIRS